MAAPELLPLTVLLVRLNMPLLAMPPAPSTVCPLRMVTPLMLTVIPKLMVKTLLLLLPSMIVVEAPPPVMVRSPVIVSSFARVRR